VALVKLYLIVYIELFGTALALISFNLKSRRGGREKIDIFSLMAAFSQSILTGFFSYYLYLDNICVLVCMFQI